MPSDIIPQDTPLNQYPTLPNTLKGLAVALNRPNSTTLRMLDALLGAPDGLTREQLQQETFGYPAEPYLSAPYNNLHVTICNYNHGRVKHAPTGLIARENKRYRLVRLDLDLAQVHIETRGIVPLPLLVDGNRLICRVVDGRLVVEGEAG